MSKSARAWEQEIRDALRALPKNKNEERPALVAGFYQLMRLEFEDNLLTAKSPECAAEPLPRSRPAKLAGRDAPTANACIARLLDVGLIHESAGGYDLPQVRRIFEIRSRDRGYKSDNPPGVGSGVGIPTGGGSEVGSETPPLVSPPPITLSSSLPSPVGERGDAARWADARRFALGYLSANDQQFLIKGKEPLSKLVFRIGREQALAEVRASTRPGVDNPYALAWHHLNNPPEDRPTQHRLPQPRRAIGIREDN